MMVHCTRCQAEWKAEWQASQVRYIECYACGAPGFEMIEKLSRQHDDSRPDAKDFILGYIVIGVSVFALSVVLVELSVFPRWLPMVLTPILTPLLFAWACQSAFGHWRRN